ncbi:hypothetical protein JCM17380_04370 [Desulfosporosinus burensis]
MGIIVIIPYLIVFLKKKLAIILKMYEGILILWEEYNIYHLSPITYHLSMAHNFRVNQDFYIKGGVTIAPFLQTGCYLNYTILSLARL